MKRCCLPFELVYLVVSALFSWPLLFLLMFNSPVSKYSHLISDYDAYRHRVGELEKSSFRALDELRAWKRQFQPNHSLFDRLPAQKHKYLCVAVMSKKRIGSELNFAAQSVAALLTRTKLRLQDSILVRVFNVEQNPAQNPFLIELGDLVKVENLTAGIQNPNLRINEALDYALVMKHLTKLKCNNSLLLEDDALIANNWFSRIDSGLKYLSKRNDWAYTKLFTGYKLYDWDWVWYPSVVIKVLMLALFLHLVQYVIIHTLFPSRRLSPLSLFLLYVNCAALVVVFNATLVNPVGAGVHEYTTGFGTVSVLVPMSKSIAIADYLKNRVNGFFENREHFQAKDLLLDEFRRTNRLREFIIEPSLVQHMGIYSSVYMRDVTSEGYRRMFKSFSFLSDFDPIKFDLEYFLN